VTSASRTQPLNPSIPSALPAHVAIIMDGNGRWAETRGLSRSEGHREGLVATRRAVEFFANHGAKALTVFAFSSENWQRPREEVAALLDLFVSAIEAELPELLERGVRLRFIGEREAFPEQLRQRMAEAENATGANASMTLVVALGYGGRWDILQAAQRWLREAQGGEPDPETFERYLSTAGLPPLDLLIRTGGEQRISNFLLWQSAYAELCFLDVLWPDVDETALQEALDVYARRQRRFGCTPAQLQAGDA
jgi:undecaprenyl diphosphate synthase